MIFNGCERFYCVNCYNISVYPSAINNSKAMEFHENYLISLKLIFISVFGQASTPFNDERKLDSQIPLALPQV